MRIQLFKTKVSGTYSDMHTSALSFLFCFLFSLQLTAPSFARQVQNNTSALKPLSAVDQAKIIQQLKRALSEKYVLPQVAEQLNQMLDDKLKRGAYRSPNDRIQFARTLTDHLQRVSNDKHLAVRFDAPDPDQQAELDHEDLEKIDFLESYTNEENLGIKRIGRLSGNIGYIDLRVFGLTQFAGPAIANAMQSLSNSDSLIIDLRENLGGSPDTVVFFASYFLPPKTRLNDIYDRREDKTTQTWSLSQTPTPAYDSNKKVYLLTSKKTFSAAEDFAYTLQSMKRCTIIGEVTGGGAHPTMKVRLSNQIAAYIPYGRSINPITKTNWEGVGVQPEIIVDKALAFKTAYALAIKELRDR